MSKKAVPIIGTASTIQRIQKVGDYCNLIKVIFFVRGFTVNRKRPEMVFVVAEATPDPPSVRVPPFSFGDPCGRS